MGWCFLWVIGGLLIVLSTLRSENALIPLLTAVAALWPLIRGKIRILLVILLASFLVRWGLGERDMGWDILIGLAGLALFAPYAHWLCPRCELHLAKSWNQWRTYEIKPFCQVCGRSRLNVKPFQHMIQPEIWDGAYYDEGGGPQPDTYYVELTVYYTTERWKRRQARHNKSK